MPLPDHDLKIYGGCQCHAIRYRITIPPLSSRPLHPNYKRESSEPPVHLPYIFTDHCNDCRGASGSILPAWICPAVEQVEANFLESPSFQEKDNAPIKVARADGHETIGQRGSWLPASEVFSRKMDDRGERTPLSFYESSPGRLRSFCSRCGTNLAYVAEDMPGMVDFVLGTVDREFLETEALHPERHLWWELGIDWIKELVTHGDLGKKERHRTDDLNDRL